MTALRLLPCGENALLVEAPDDRTCRALFAALQGGGFDGLTALRPAAKTIYLRYDPVKTDPATIARALDGLTLSGDAAPTGETHVIAMRYDGPDLDDVARMTGLTRAEVIARHQAATFSVAFTGFAPGFAYLACDDPVFTLPRRSSPRPAVAAGSVALAGGYGAVYPSQSPGGWQIIGHTDVPMWDLGRDRAALLAPGDQVKFVAGEAEKHVPPVKPDTPNGLPSLTVDSTLRPILSQDLGRAGREGDGLSPSGAMDRDAFIFVNEILGNPPNTAALELCAPATLTALAPETLAFGGAEMALTLIPKTGPRQSLPCNRPFGLDAGDRLEIGPATRGVYGYLARRGGFAGAPVLGSAAFDTLARLGPEPCETHDVIPAGGVRAGAVDPAPLPPSPPPASGDTVTIPLLPGPRTDWFTPEAREALTGTLWRVTPEMSRVGLRLDGGPVLARAVTGELASEAVIPGSIQIPHDGRPMVFLRDAPVTGGYPVIAVVAPAALSQLAQCPAGTRLRFVLTEEFAPLTCKAAQ